MGMARTPTYPILIRNQSVTVRINRERSSSTKSGFIYRVSWVGSQGVENIARADLEAARDEATRKADAMANGLQQSQHLTRSDVLELTEARVLAGDVPLLSALEEWKRARELVGPSVLQVCEAWSRQRTAEVERKTVKEAVDLFIQAKVNAHKEGERTYRSKLTPAEVFFPQRFIDSITTAEWEKYLNQFDDPVTRNDMRKRAVSLCRWAQRHNHIAEDVKLSIEKTERSKEPSKEIGIITPAVYRKLLLFFLENHVDHLAALVLAGFCGVRSDEIHGKRKDRSARQIWEDIHLREGYLRVTAVKENTASNRTVNICPAAVKWLRLCPNRKGYVCVVVAMEKVRALAIAAGFALPDNCFRHSFISYFVAKTGDKFAAATQAGNSVPEVDACYRTPVPPQRGHEWFAITPPAGAAKLRSRSVRNVSPASSA